MGVLHFIGNYPKYQSTATDANKHIIVSLIK